MMEVTVPRESVNDDSVLVQRVLVADGASVNSGDVVVEIETSKTTIEVSAPASGRISHRLTVGLEMAIGATLFKVADAAEQASATSAAVVALEPRSEMNGVESPALLSRAAAATAARLGTDLRPFAGRWVTSAEIRGGRPHEAVPELSDDEDGSGVAEPPRRAALPAPAIPFKAVVRNKRKRAEIDNLVEGQHAATTSTIGIRIAVPGERLVPPAYLFRNGISDLIVYEGARLFKEYPDLNGFYLDPRTSGHYEEVRFGLSFDNRQNLKVLALPNPDRMTLMEVQNAFTELLELYESGKPIPTQMLTSSTVTLSDLSGSGASFMLPLLNGRQSLILGVVRRDDSEFEIFASFDHRLSEGLTVSRFLEALRERIVSHYRDENGAARISCDACGKSMQVELRLGARGFISLIGPDGRPTKLCRNCFEGR